jgi:adsorption protein B
LAWGDVALNALDIFNHELMLFAAIGFLVGGIDDVAVDLVFGWQALRHRRRGNGERLERLPGPEHRLAVFVPAWDEAAVIGAMLQTALARFDHPDFDIYVGTYPNDTATIDAVRAIADRDARVRLVIGDTPGPTTKAACLNTLCAATLNTVAGEAGYCGPFRDIVGR